jgi:hypothetical protein
MLGRFRVRSVGIKQDGQLPTLLRRPNGARSTIAWEPVQGYFKLSFDEVRVWI